MDFLVADFSPLLFPLLDDRMEAQELSQERQPMRRAHFREKSEHGARERH
jgi:hypothetical protein